MKTSILHQFTWLKASVVGILSGIEYATVGFSSVVKINWYSGMYIPLSDDKHRFVQKVHSTHANGLWKPGRNSKQVATLPHAAVVLYATI